MGAEGRRWRLLAEVQDRDGRGAGLQSATAPW